MTWSPTILCSCGTSIHDEPETRQLHEDYWHSERFPATYTSSVEVGE